ncbi:MAG: uroporphyrinogen decarboxylase family protein [Candidatus Hydrothermarchaeales archaeon]
MAPKDEVITAFELEVPERLPVSIMGGGAWTIATSRNTFLGLSKDAEKMSEVIIKTSDLLKSDIVFVGSGYNNFHVAAFGGKIKTKSVGVPVLAAPLVDNLDDLNDLDEGSLDLDPVIGTIRGATKRVAEAIGDNYMVTATSWGPFTWAGQVVGIERFMMDITRNPDFVREVLDFSVKAIVRFYKPLLDDGIIKMISLAEPSASGNLISRKHFEEFALPYIQKVSKEIKKKRAYTFLHICGITNDRIEEVGESGVNCVSLDSNVDLGYAKEILGMKMCIAGNVDPINVMAKGSTEDVISVSKRCIGLAAKGGGFILMPGCDLSPSVPLSNIKALISTANTWRPS